MIPELLGNLLTGRGACGMRFNDRRVATRRTLLDLRQRGCWWTPMDI
jgi:hypothetical protein